MGNVEKNLAIIEPWMDTQTLKLRAGEMSEQEVRTVKAVLTSIISEISSISESYFGSDEWEEDMARDGYGDDI